MECPACGHENPEGARFCNACGRRLAAAPSLAAQGERKQVTVLFCDVEGSMGLAGSLDAEAWRAVMARFFDAFREEVDRFEGTVDKFTGDGAMALFGAPVALEDHAARACHTALRLRERVAELASAVRAEHGLPFAVRMGLHSGEVVAGAVGAEDGVEYTAIGNTVGLAARMEAVAEPGRPCLSAATAALVEGLFELEDRGELTLRGVEEPVRGFALIATRAGPTRLEAVRGHGWSRFVGREDELHVLEAALTRAHRSGQVVGVVAEAGQGKSRLCREFVRHCRERGIDVTEGRGVAHGRRVPLLPVVQILRTWFGIDEGAEPKAAQRIIGTRLLSLDERFADALPVLYEFLGVPAPELPPPRMSPEARQRALFGVVRQITEARASEGPAVLLVEDLHWLDPGSEAFLENLVESLPGSRTLLVVNFRPEYRAAWTAKSYYEQLPLAPLSGPALEGMLGALVGDDPSVDGLAELVGQRTGGNPFFVEEVVQGLVESGTLAGSLGAYRLTRSVDAIEIPPTVQAVLAARIDRLPEREKSTLGSASVIGRHFSEPVLRLTTGMAEDELAGALDSLRAAELVYEKRPYPEAEYAFKHALTEEVAYRSQLSERRSRLHAAVAEAIESVYADRLDELAAVLANHWEEAGRPMAAARWGARAAGWAGQHNPADALRHWERVRSRLRSEPDSDEVAALRMSACLWLLAFGWRLGSSREQIDELRSEGVALARARDQKGPLAAVLSAAAVATAMTGDVPAALVRADEAERAGRESGVAELQVAGGLQYLKALAGDLEGALAKLEETDALLDRQEDPFAAGRATVGFSFRVWDTFFRGQILLDLGRLREAERCLRRGVDLAREHDDVESLGWALNDLSAVAYYTGEPGESLAHSRRSLELADKLGSSFSRAAASRYAALVHLARGEAEEAEAAVRHAIDEVARTGTGRQYEANGLAILAEALLRQGDAGGARDRAAEGVAAGERCGTRIHEARARWLLGRALVATGELEAAERELDAALQTWAALAPGCVPWALEALADLAAARGDRDEQARRLERARDLYAEQGATGHQRRLSERLARPRGRRAPA